MPARDDPTKWKAPRPKAAKYKAVALGYWERSEKAVNDGKPLKIMYSEFKETLKNKGPRESELHRSVKPPKGYFFYNVTAGLRNLKWDEGTEFGDSIGPGEQSADGGFSWSRDICYVHVHFLRANLTYRICFWAAKKEDLKRVKEGKPGLVAIEKLPLTRPEKPF